MHQFLVRFVIVERDNRDAVVELVTERVDSVVYNNKVFKVAVGDNPQVLNIYSFFGTYAVISVETILN
jgi:hypothetical protein